MNEPVGRRGGAAPSGALGPFILLRGWAGQVGPPPPASRPGPGAAAKRGGLAREPLVRRGPRAAGGVSGAGTPRPGPGGARARGRGGGLAMEERGAAGPGPGEQLRALLEGAGGRGGALLVAELWDREQSRRLLRDFARHVFPEPPPREEEEEGGRQPGRAGPRGPQEAAAAPRPGPPGRAIRSPLVFVLCREASLRAPESRRRLREILRDVRARRRPRPREPRAALVGVLLEEPGGGRGEAPGAEGGRAPEPRRRLEALLGSVFGRALGGPVQAASYCAARPAAAADVQSAACRALRAAAGQRPEETMGERLGFQRLLRCFPWSSWSRGKGRTNSSSSPAEDAFQEPSEELALTILSPNGHCEDIEGRTGA
ncbi:uncharacterized protein C2orf72 homolog [Macrotis lagotis]|uniref:uncharacterized protein C2orf72 homolog n=1 Tax=Macrotis lagotis TaxID=92651 RepID=UPI003D687A20